MIQPFFGTVFLGWIPESDIERKREGGRKYFPSFFRLLMNSSIPNRCILCHMERACVFFVIISFRLVISDRLPPWLVSPASSASLRLDYLRLIIAIVDACVSKENVMKRGDMGKGVEHTGIIVKIVL